MARLRPDQRGPLQASHRELTVRHSRPDLTAAAALLSAGGLPAPPRGARLAQALLWNLGVIAVPVGVLAQTRLAVVAGSVSLIAALLSPPSTARPALTAAAARPSPLARGYACLLVVMTASVFVGTALAWDTPWA
jgi:hypothetical protein